ncbi:hypothetical protein EK904_009692 [Melospiza melodia maxima]|nr:hypothetical protein EK904_009692 [Melospiza melodia maxima]
MFGESPTAIQGGRSLPLLASRPEGFLGWGMRRDIVCYTYWRCLHLLIIAHYTAVYTKEILFTERPLGLLLPPVLQNIWTGISSLSVITPELVFNYVFSISILNNDA